MIANLDAVATLLERAGPAGGFMKALADQVRRFVTNATDEAVVAFGVSAGIVGVMAGGTTVAADAPPGGGRRPAPKRKAVPVKRERESSAVNEDIQSRVVQAVTVRPGLRIGEIAKATGLARWPVARAIKAERGKRIEQQGERGAARYYPIEAD